MPSRSTAALLAALSLSFAIQANSQNPSSQNNLTATPDATPAAAYNTIITPFNQTREDMHNWSQIEVDAYTRATTEANAACQRLEQTPFEGEQLFGLARLCALGLNWPGAYSAALRYTYTTNAPHRIDAYTILCQADINTNNVREIPDHLEQLASTAPFTFDVNQLLVQMLDITQFTSPQAAVRIALLLEPRLLLALAAPRSAIDPTLSSALLQDEAWKLLILLHRDNHTTDEQAFKAQLEAALAAANPQHSIPQAPTPVEQSWYNLLGKPLPHALHSLLPHTPTAAKELLILSSAPLQENSSLYRSLQILQTQRSAAERVVLAVIAPSIPRTIHLRYTLINAVSGATTSSLSAPQGPVFFEVGPSHTILSITLGDPAWLESQPILQALLPPTASPTPTPTD